MSRDETPIGVVPANWPFFAPLPPLPPRPQPSRRELAAEVQAALDGEAAKRQACLDGQVTRCEHCGRTEGLCEPKPHGTYVVTKCDCNYQHIRTAPRRAVRGGHAELVQR